MSVTEINNNHPRTKLICGDCMVQLKKFEDDSIDLIVTDPPYRTTSRGNCLGGGMFKKKINLKGQVFTHNNIDCSEYAPEFYRVLKDGGHCYVMTNHVNLVNILNVFIGSDEGNLTCLDIRDGTLKWSHSVGDKVQSTPAIKDNLIVFTSNNGNAYVLNKYTGLEEFSYNPGTIIYQSRQKGYTVTEGTSLTIRIAKANDGSIPADENIVQECETDGLC